ncbi:MAG: Crp/Fnr family transcriptional regulator [Anaerolineales bacterium]
MLKKVDVSLLQAADLFDGMSLSDLERVVQAAQTRGVTTGEFLFHQGDPARHLFVLSEGRVKLMQFTPDGQQIIIRYIGPGETFAVLAVLREGDYPIAAQVVQDGVALSWNRAVMKQLMDEIPRLERNALSIMADRVREFQDRVRELSTERVERRIARALLRLTHQAGREIKEGVLIDMPLSRQDLAEMSGTTLFTVSRTLKDWEEQGVVKCGRARVTVISPDQLALIAEDRS